MERWDAPVQMRLPMSIAKAGRDPQAAGSQRTVADWDGILTDLARREHPAVAWWWGARHNDKGYGAFCYLCDHMVAYWSDRWPITRAAVDLLDMHRAGHFSLAMGHARGDVSALPDAER